MTRTTCTTTLVILLILTAMNEMRADQVMLRNGDRVTGSIVKKDGTTLTIKTAHFGTVSVDWEQVQSLQSDAPLNVILPGGQTVQATLQPAEDKVELKETGQTIARAELVAIRNADEQRAHERLLAPGWADLWAGTATIGLAGTRGNAQTGTFTVGMNAARITRTDKTRVYFSAIKASALINQLKADTAEAFRGGLGYNHTITARLFVNTFNDYEYDRFQNLDLRVVLGGGLGYGLWKGGRGQVELVGGGAYNRESFSPAAPALQFTRNSAEAYWGSDWIYRLSDATSLVHNFRMFHNLSQTGERRMNIDLGANTRLLKWLVWNLAISDRYSSRPVAGRKTNDFLYTTGIGISFSR